MPALPSGDGRRHEHEEELTAEFMFGLLDYQTWNIYAGPRWIGQVTLNTADHEYTFTAGDDFLPAYTWMQSTKLRNWLRWLEAHKADRGHHKTAF